LGCGLVEILPGGLVLDEEFAGPEEVDFSEVSGEFFHGFLERGDGAALDAEDVEEVVPVRLALGLLGSGVPPFAGEADGAFADFVLGNMGHREADWRPI
jgi:hypothetical protein